MTGEDIIIVQSMEIDRYTDKQIVTAILANDSKMIEYFFCKKCSKLLSYIAVSMFNKRIDRNELINELLIYIAAENWHKLSQFDFRSSLMTWISVVSIRFFQKRRKELIDSGNIETLKCQNDLSYSPITFDEQRMDICKTVNQMTNHRYKDAIIALDFEDRKPEEVAIEMAITVDNLYNLHRRALIQLRTILGKKEDYYD